MQESPPNSEANDPNAIDVDAILSQIDQEFAQESAQAREYNQKLKQQQIEADEIMARERAKQANSAAEANSKATESSISDENKYNHSLVPSDEPIKLKKGILITLTLKEDVDKCAVLRKWGYRFTDIFREAIRAQYKEIFPDIPAYAQVQIDRQRKKEQAEARQREIDAMTPHEYHERFLEPSRYFSEIKNGEIVFYRWKSKLGFSRHYPIGQIKNFTENPFKQLIDADYEDFLRT